MHDSPSRRSHIMSTPASSELVTYRHTRLVRIAHWINAVSFVLLVPSGIGILLAHPEFYWGETGYYGDPTAFGLPFEPSFYHSGWGRTVHFFFAWLLVLNGAVYLIVGLVNGHFRRRFLPDAEQLRPAHIVRELIDHLRLRAPHGEQARTYNLLQKLSYLLVVFLLLPLMLMTGLTMSPAVTATFPDLFDLFGGRQSARTLHFIAAVLLVCFLFIHVFQVFVAGFRNEMRAMITGKFKLESERS